MSTRAYKVVQREKYAKDASFNLSWDNLFDELFEEFIHILYSDDDGEVRSFHITTENLKEMKDKFEKIKEGYSKEDQNRTLEIFQDIEKDFGDKGKAYYCAF